MEEKKWYTKTKQTYLILFVVVGFKLLNTNEELPFVSVDELLEI